MKRTIGSAVALVLFLALASVSLAESLTNAQILDSLNVAHTKLEGGDRPGAKAELAALSAKLKPSTVEVHKTWRRQVQWIVLKLSVGMVSSAENGLHDLLKAVSSAGSNPTPPPPPPGQPTPPQPGPPGR